AVGKLHEDACAVAGVRLAAARTAMLQVEQNLERLDDDVMRLAALEIDDEADAARIMFVAWIVESLGWRLDRVHGAPMPSWRISTNCRAARLRGGRLR